MSASIPITCIFRAVWPSDTAKHAARAAGMSTRTAQGWMAERFTPSAATLLRMADRNDNLRAELIRRLTEINNADMAPRDLPVDGSAPPAASGAAHGQCDALASEG